MTFWKHLCLILALNVYFGCPSCTEWLLPKILCIMAFPVAHVEIKNFTDCATNPIEALNTIYVNGAFGEAGAPWLFCSRACVLRDPSVLILEVQFFLRCLVVPLQLFPSLLRWQLCNSCDKSSIKSQSVIHISPSGHFLGLALLEVCCEMSEWHELSPQLICLLCSFALC